MCLKSFVRKILLLSVLLAASCLCAGAQGKLYTRKARLVDFPTRTTKVVVGGSTFLDFSFKEEISARWRISPYEFCTPEDYEALRTDSSLYFLNIASDAGVAFLILTKGGREDEKDSLKKPFEVVRIPIASIDDPSGKELMFMGAFIDIMQAFVEDAMISDQAAYTGLKWYNSRKFSGMEICVNDEDRIDTLYLAGVRNILLGITVVPTTVSFGSRCYKMLISADSHELYYYASVKYRGPMDTRFTDKEIKQFNRRNGVPARVIHNEI